MVGALAVCYALAPQRPLGTVLHRASDWLAGAGTAANYVWLPSESGLAHQAGTLAQYGPATFLGCDLTGEYRQIWLITNWRLDQGSAGLEVNLRLITPGGVATISRQALDRPVLMASLPLAFFDGNSRGQVWLQVADRTSDQPITPTNVLVQPASDGWLRVCR